MYKETAENEEIEFKEKLSPDSMTFIKSVVAFANGNGGRFVFGVRDSDHEITGIEKNELFSVMDSITNTIVENSEPQIRPVLTIQSIEGKTVINVDIPKGMQKPYFVKSLGILEGTFIRISATTRHADYETVQELILKGKNRSFDQTILENPISDEDVNAFCDDIFSHAIGLNEKKITKNQLISWKIIAERGDKL